MLYCKTIGGLGNSLFQMAACIAASLRNSTDYCISLQNENPHYPDQKPYIFFGVKYCKFIPDNTPVFTEPDFSYTPIPKNLTSAVLSGYWQSELYFQDYREQVLKSFAFEWHPKEDWVSIHVRRGDYVPLQKFHPVITKEYLSEAINHYRERGYKNFLVFSDDFSWTIENINDKAYPNCVFQYSVGRSEMEDLQLGSCAAHQICSNSSFSLWQHILNKNPEKSCIVPLRWFGESLPHSTIDLFPTTAIAI